MNSFRLCKGWDVTFDVAKIQCRTKIRHGSLTKGLCTRAGSRTQRLSVIEPCTFSALTHNIQTERGNKDDANIKHGWLGDAAA